MDRDQKSLYPDLSVEEVALEQALVLVELVDYYLDYYCS